MARSRNIKPGFFTNDILGALDPLARLLFAGMWGHADREGRLHDRPRRLKAEILPYDDCDADTLLSDLQNAGFILRYEVNETKYIQCVNFKKHQNPHVKEPASEIPAPDVHQISPVQESDKSELKTEQATLIPSSLIPDSSPLIPDSLIPSKSLVGKPPLPNPFDAVWKQYPKRNGNNPRKDAEEAWNARIKAKVDPSVMLAGLERYASWCEATGKIGTETVMRASTFFGPGKCFEQEFALPTPKKVNGATSQWWLSNQGVEAKAKELGVIPRGGESYADLKQRVFDKLEMH